MSSVAIYDGLESVRRRPGLFVGDTGIYGLHHLVYEVLDNAIEEALAGFCTKIALTIQANNSITVIDDGRGIPVGPHPKLPGMDMLDVVMTTLQPSPALERPARKVSGGIHGIGVSCVNALSDWLELEVMRDGKVHRRRYVRGVSQKKSVEAGVTGRTGTKVSFKPDATIFDVTEYDFVTLARRVRELACLNAGLHLSVNDERSAKREEFCFENGLSSYVELLNRSKRTLHREPIHFEEDADGVSIDVAMQWTEDDPRRIDTYVNTVKTPDGGTHQAGLESALTQILGGSATKGLTAIVSVKLVEPRYGGSMKTRLDNVEIKGRVERLVVDRLGAWLNENPTDAKRVLAKVGSG